MPTLRALSLQTSGAAVVAAVVLASGLACSQQNAAPPGAAAATAAPAAAPAAAPTLAVTLLEPAEGSFAGHIEMFRWSPVAGADAYHVKISSLAGRVVWESPALTTAEARLPGTVSLEPEAYMWQVTAMKGTETIVVSAAGRFTVTP